MFLIIYFEFQNRILYNETNQNILLSTEMSVKLKINEKIIE